MAACKRRMEELFVELARIDDYPQTLHKEKGISSSVDKGNNIEAELTESMDDCNV